MSSLSLVCSLKSELIAARLEDVPEIPYVDGVCSLGNQLVAVKYVGHAKIIVFRTNSKKLQPDQTTVMVESLLEIPWRPTTEIYMNLGYQSSHQMLACGDDEGVVWLYKMSSWLFSAAAKKPEVLPQKDRPFGEF